MLFLQLLYFELGPKIFSPFRLFSFPPVELFLQLRYSEIVQDIYYIKKTPIEAILS